jgi:hypothetical protein
MDIDTQHRIIWQKWIDPFGRDEEAFDFDPYVGDYENDEEIDTDDENEELKIQKNPQAIKAIATPMGIIPFNDNTASGKIFNFWMGHTNFDISKNIVNIIEKIDGVETLDVFTRYRFRIAIGKAFDDSQIMRNINKKIYNELNNV